MLDHKTYDDNGRYTIHAYAGARHRAPWFPGRDWRERTLIASVIIVVVLLTVLLG
jgi:hypothetical protein